MTRNYASRDPDNPAAPWDVNEWGVWCPACGQILSEESEGVPEQCPTCGFPEDIEQMTEYFT